MRVKTITSTLTKIPAKSVISVEPDVAAALIKAAEAESEEGDMGGISDPVEQGSIGPTGEILG